MTHAIRLALALSAFVLAMSAQGATGQLQEWPWLGVVITDISSGNVYGYTGGGGGSYVTGIEEPGPASAAGLRRHDIIIGLDGHTALNTRELTCLLQTKRPGETVLVMLSRGGRQKVMQVTLGNWPEAREFPRPVDGRCGREAVSALPGSKPAG